MVQPVAQRYTDWAITALKVEFILQWYDPELNSLENFIQYYSDVFMCVFFAAVRVLLHWLFITVTKWDIINRVAIFNLCI
jgi:hypothetical protein